MNFAPFTRRPAQVVATTDIIDGDELCFSYGERSNDDFFVHYGFVPLRNPRDEVILFESVESALDWYALESGLPVGVGGSSGDEEADKEVLVRDLRRIGAPGLCTLCLPCLYPSCLRVCVCAMLSLSAVSVHACMHVCAVAVPSARERGDAGRCSGASLHTAS